MFQLHFQIFKYLFFTILQKALTPIIISLVPGDLTAGDFFPTRPTVVFLWKTDDLCDQINSKFTAKHMSLLQNFIIPTDVSKKIYIIHSLESVLRNVSQKRTTYNSPSRHPTSHRTRGLWGQKHWCLCGRPAWCHGRLSWRLHCRRPRSSLSCCSSPGCFSFSPRHSKRRDNLINVSTQCDVDTCGVNNYHLTMTYISEVQIYWLQTESVRL